MFVGPVGLYERGGGPVELPHPATGVHIRPHGGLQAELHEEGADLGADIAVEVENAPEPFGSSHHLEGEKAGCAHIVLLRIAREQLRVSRMAIPHQDHRRRVFFAAETDKHDLCLSPRRRRIEQPSQRGVVDLAGP